MESGGIAVADEDEGAGPRLQHVGEILRPHHGRHRGIDACRTHHVARDRGREGRLRRVIFQHRIASLVGQPGARAVQPRGAFDHLVQALLQEIAHIGRQAAGGAAQLRGLRDDVVGVAGLEHADRHHGGLQRIDIA